MRWSLQIAVLFALVSPLYPAEPSTVAESEWLVRSWQTPEGLPQNTINSLLETHDGFLWVGTGGGLARYDGYRFRNFGLQDGLRSIRISTLAEDPNGTLWIGTTGGGVSQYQHGRLTTFGTQEGFPPGADVVSMVAGRDGALWVGTTEGLLKWSDGRFARLGEAEGLPQGQARAVIEDTEGWLWVAMLEGGVFRSKGGRFERIEQPGPSYLYSLRITRDGTVWGGAGNGQLWQWRNGAWRSFGPADGLPLASFSDLEEDASGTLWICAGSAGLFRKIGERFEAVPVDGWTPAEAIYTMTLDREGSLWIGTRSGGLRRLTRRLLQYWNLSSDSKPVGIGSLAQDADGGWWASGGSAGIFRFADGRFTRVQDPGISPGVHQIYCTTSAEDGSVWAAGESCAYRFKSGEPTRGYLDAPIKGEAIRALCADGDILWLGTYYSTLLKLDATGVHVEAPRGSFAGDITSIVRGDSGTLWIGSAGGLHQWKDGKLLRTWDTGDGLITASIRALCRDSDGTLWIGTQGGGLARLKNGKLLNITTQQGLIDDVISQIVADDLGALWLGTNRGIMRVERAEIDALAAGEATDLHPIILGRNEGLISEQCSGGYSPTAVKSRDGNLFFPTVRGVAEIDPRRFSQVSGPEPLPIIHRVSVDGRSQDFDRPLLIPPGPHRIEIRFTAAALRGGEWLRFRYRLVDVDEGWNYAGPSRLAAYDGLPPGRYTFEVAALDGHGTWSQPGASLTFLVQPFFWQRLSFQIVAAILLIGVNAAFIRWRLKRKHALELAALERERHHQAELAHAGRVSLLGELSASLAHELKQPLAAILSNAQAGLRFLADGNADLDEVRDILKDIAASDRRASEIIERMRAMMKSGTTEKDALDFNADVRLVLMLLRSDLVSRGVEVTTELAEDLPPLKGDHIQLQQVLLNLIVNGCDAMHQAPREQRRLSVQTTFDGGFVRVAVRDQGVGIAPEMLERIFEPFYSTKEAGLGMGLAICRAITKSHGGHLWAENNGHGGATFWFTLKMDDVAASTAEANIEARDPADGRSPAPGHRPDSRLTTVELR